MTSRSLEDTQTILYTFWEDLSIIKRVDLSSKILISQPVRTAILNVLSNGISSESSENSKSKNAIRIRHALNVREIQNEINNYFQHRKKNSVKLTNVYFHLQKLLELGLIQVVATILEGNHHVAYFGRTAKFFSSINPGEMIFREHSIAQFLVYILEGIKPNVNKEQMMTLIQQILQREEEMFDTVTEWVVRNRILLQDQKINFWALTVFLNRLNALDPELERLYSEVIDIIGFLK